MAAFWEVPAIVLALLLWLQSPPANLADASRREALRRQLMPQATRSLTNADVDRQPRRPDPPPPPPPASLSEIAAAAAAAAGDAAKKPEETHDEPWWRDRMKAAREALERDRLLQESLQSRVNALTADWSARDDPAQRQQLYEQRVRVLAELEKMKDQVTADQKMITEIEDDARRQSVPAGWIR